ncbi:MAG TPA: methyltransferase domain-containing protein [Aestuariivirgaceae bacterium]|nr:methyltransferase domain-containing protein [Aestuariivirgaceae bacterium]
MSNSAAVLANELLRSVERAAPANVALMHLLLRASHSRDAGQAIDLALRSAAQGGRPAIERLQEVAKLWLQNPQAWETVRAIGTWHGSRHHSAGHALDYWSAAYDEAARTSPEASVALYSLGNPELLNAATYEVVSYLERLGVLGPQRKLLELGCGIGRLIEALAPLVGSAVGIDISHAMVQHAEQRCRRFGHVEIAKGPAHDLTAFADESFDIVLAADVFPYIWEAGPEIVNMTLTETARVLAPGGAVVVLNFSYGSEPDADRAGLIRLAEANGLNVVQYGDRPFKLWDGMAFVLEKIANAT